MMFLSKSLQYDEICMSSYQVILAYLCSNMTMKIGPKILKMPKNPVSLFFFCKLSLGHVKGLVGCGLGCICHYFFKILSRYQF